MPEGRECMLCSLPFLERGMKNNRFVSIVLIPSFLFLFVFVVFPVVYGLGISFYDYNPANSQNPFTGLENYRRLIHDEIFWLSVKNTILFCVIAVMLNIVVTLFLAEIISVLPAKWMKTMFRTILFKIGRASCRERVF